MLTLKEVFFKEGNAIQNLRKEINLQAEYNHLNQLLFKGKLPNVPLKWTKSKKWIGQVSAGAKAKMIFGRKEVDPDSVRVTGLKISDFYTLTKEQFLTTLAHEMIHVYFLAIEKNWEESHGADFQAVAHNKSSILGIEIPLSEEPSILKIATPKQGKEFGVVVFTPEDPEDDRAGILVTKPETMKREWETLKDALGFSRLTIAGYFSSNPELQTYTIRKHLTDSRGGVNWSRTHDENLLNDIQTQGKKFKTSTLEERRRERK